MIDINVAHAVAKRMIVLLLRIYIHNLLLNLCYFRTFGRWANFLFDTCLPTLFISFLRIEQKCQFTLCKLLLNTVSNHIFNYLLLTNSSVDLFFVFASFILNLLSKYFYLNRRTINNT